MDIQAAAVPLDLLAPYANEHAARLRDPDAFVRIVQIWEKESQGIRALGGPLKSNPRGGVVIQAIRFKSSKWTPAEAKKWLKDHDYKPIRFEEATGDSQSSGQAPDLICMAAPVNVLAAEGEKKLPTFQMVAYTGGLMNLGGWAYPVAVDLAGLEKADDVAVCADHDHSVRGALGHCTDIEVKGNSLEVAGALSVEGELRNTIVGAAKNGFKWKSSIGARALRVEFVDEGGEAEVNGQTVKGPCYVARQSRLYEVSFVVMGADERTAVQVAASARPHGRKESDMKFEEWLKAKGLDAEKLTEAEMSAQRVLFEAEVNAKVASPPAPPAPAAPPAAPSAPDAVAEMRAQAAAEAKRIAAIRKHAAKHPDIEAKAIEEGWDENRVQLEVLRADRPKAPAFVQGAGQGVNALVLEAAMRLGSDEPKKRVEADKAYTPQVLDAAHKLRRMGIKGLIEQCCRLEGRAVPPISASNEEWIRAGFTTVSLPGVLGDSARKVLLAAYDSVPSYAPRVACKLSAKDFKTHTGYRVESGKILPKVGPGGELKHGNLAEDHFSFFVDTYGEIIGLTRQMLINDDLGAFLSIPLRIGEKAGYTREYLFWALVVANTGNFFSAGNRNVVTGEDIDAAGYDAATQAMEEMVDGQGNHIMIVPKIVVVPPALAGPARRMRSSTNLVVVGLTSTAAKALEGAANVYDYEPISVPFLSGQDEDWYLFPEPGAEAAFGIAYLNGVEGPTVEDCPLAGDLLGQAWRGYFDVGVCQVNPRRAIRVSKTEPTPEPTPS